MQEIIPFIGVPCFLVFCFSVVMLIKNKKKENRISKTFLVIAIISFALTGVLVSLTEEPKEQKEPDVAKTEDTIQKKDTKDDKPTKTEPKKLTKEEKFAKENSTNITLTKSIFDKCSAIGIDAEEISNLQNNSLDNEVAIIFSYNGNNFVALGNNDQIIKITCGDIVFLENANVVENINNITMSTQQEVVIRETAKDSVISALKAPQSAEFPSTSEWRFSRRGTTYYVSSFVDAQNSFGAQLRNNFVIEYTWDGNIETIPQIISFTLGNEKIV